MSFDDQVRRAMVRLERQVKIPPEVGTRWLERLRALGAELGLTDNAAPTDEQIEVMIRELYQAEADVKDARDAASPGSAEATLPSTVAPIAEVAVRGQEGARPTVLPSAIADEDLDGRDTAEDMTKVYSREPGEADAGLPGVEVKPKLATLRSPPHKPPRPISDPLAGAKLEQPTPSARRTVEAFHARHPRQTLFGGLTAPRAPSGGEREGGNSP
jgi:hypothetical protein